MPDVMAVIEVQKDAFLVHVSGKRGRYFRHFLFLGEEVHGRKKGNQPKTRVNHWYYVNLLSIQNLHYTIVGTIKDKIEKENDEEVVGGTGCSRDSKVETKQHIYEGNQEEADKAGTGLLLTTCLWIVLLGTDLVELPTKDPQDHTEDFVVILYHANVVCMNRDNDNDNDVHRAEKGPKEGSAVVEGNSLKQQSNT